MLSVGMILIAFISGSLPFSYWLGKLLLRVDVRQYGDGKPGAANVFR
jgi:glycerol-3-phosphate acyltransferase PlsY